jgi:hypothetical protein
MLFSVLLLLRMPESYVSVLDVYCEGRVKNMNSGSIRREVASNHEHGEKEGAAQSFLPGLAQYRVFGLNSHHSQPWIQRKELSLESINILRTHLKS